MSSVNRLALPPGTCLRDFRIGEVLGQGGFGITYRAVNTALDQQVAIKEYLPASFAVRDGDTLCVHPSGAESEEVFHWGLQRFLEEAKILARLSHPNIVRVLYYMSLNETGYMVMEFLNGTTLGSWLQDREGISQQDVLKILDPLTDALTLIHDNGLTHRDIKPDNIFMSDGTTPVLIDFGAARNVFTGRSQSVAAIVTPGYSPNEQYSGSIDQGPWTDIYALGAVAYRMISGVTPPDALSRIAYEMEGRPDPCHSLVQTANASFNPDTLQAIDWALKLRANERPQNLHVWREALGLERQESTQAPIVGTPDVSSNQSETHVSNAVNVAPKDNIVTLREAPTRERTFIEPIKSSRIPIMIAAAISLLIVAGTVLWWSALRDKDRIGNTMAQAFPLGTLTSEPYSISDAIGGGDEMDIIEFDVPRDGEVKFVWDDAASGARLQLINRDGQSAFLLKDGDIQLADLRAGKYFLKINSDESLSHSYTLRLQSTAPGEQERPGLNPRTALDLSGYGEMNGRDVLFEGRIWPHQREHFFKFSLDKPSRVSVTLENSAGAGSVALTDANEIASAIREISAGKTGPLISNLSAGNHFIVVNMRGDTPWAYRLKVNTEDLTSTPASRTTEPATGAEGESFETAQILLDLTTDVQNYDVKFTGRKSERYFRIRAQESGLLSLRVVGDRFNGLEVFQAENNSRIARASQPDQLSLRTNIKPGHYVLKLSASESRATGKLTLAFASGAVAGVTRNNPVLFGALGALPIEETGQLTQREPEKWFSFSLKNNAYVIVEMTGKDSGPLPEGTVMSLRDLGGKRGKSLLAREKNEIFLSRIALEEGNYTLELSAAGTDAFEYRLKLFAIEKFLGPDDRTSDNRPQARSSATVALGLDTTRADILQIAKAKARAKAITSLNNVTASAHNGREDSAAWLLTTLAHGIPYNESWTAQWLSQDRLAVSLQSRVRLLAGSEDFEAALAQPNVITNVPIPIMLKSAEAVEIGLFAWQADGTIGRIYPSTDNESYTLQPGKSIKVSEALDLNITSAPVPGKNSSEEAIIVLACKESASFAELAPTLAEVARSSLTRAIETPVFLERLARFCPRSLKVRVLAYRVENPGG